MSYMGSSANTTVFRCAQVQMERQCRIESVGEHQAGGRWDKVILPHHSSRPPSQLEGCSRETLDIKLPAVSYA